MKIAATYDNGVIFQHFGHTENFKVYDVEDNKVISSQVLDSSGSGHGALASLLDENAIDILICGGIGAGAINALESAGIELISGVSGNADDAVDAYLRGELKSAGCTCDHHGEGHDCGNHEEEHSCAGSCGGGCHSSLEGPNVGKTCKVHYTGTFNDGTKFDSSYDRGQTLDFVCGAGQMIPGFDKAVATMEVGQIIDVHLMPEEAYGPSDPNAIITIDLSQMPGAEELKEGEQVYLQNQFGQPFPALVTAKTDETITFDLNHEMAGKELNFKIELVECI